jgi:type I restriction enzyme, S subunit
MIHTKPTHGPWPISTVGVHFNIQLGKMLDAAHNTGDLKPYLGNKAVQWNQIDIAAAGLVPLTRKDQVRYRLMTNDLLVCEGGEVGRAAIWRDELDECYYQKALHRLRAKAGFDPRVMMALLEYWSETGLFDALVTQTSIAHLPRARFLTMPLPAIPPDEQERIGAALDDANQMIVVLESRIAKGKAIKQGMMQQLLSGESRLPGFSKPWRTVRLGDVTTMSSGGTPPSATPRYYGGDIPWVSISDMTGASKYVRQTERTLSREGLSHSTARVYAPGVVLYAMYASLGECALPVRRVSSSQAILGILPGRELNREYLYYDLCSRKRQVKDLGQHGTQSNLNAGMVRNFLLDLPGLEEQQAIAVVLASVDDALNSLKARLQKMIAIKQGMMQELLTGRTRLPVIEATAA